MIRANEIALPPLPPQTWKCVFVLEHTSHRRLPVDITAAMPLTVPSVFKSMFVFIQPKYIPKGIERFLYLDNRLSTCARGSKMMEHPRPHRPGRISKKPTLNQFFDILSALFIVKDLKDPDSRN